MGDTTTPKLVWIGSRVDRQFAEQIAAMAKQQDRSISSFVRLALADRIEKEAA